LALILAMVMLISFMLGVVSPILINSDSWIGIAVLPFVWLAVIGANIVVIKLTFFSTLQQQKENK
jgi:hypothetical protein